MNKPFRINNQQASALNNTLIRFHLRGSEDFDAVRIGLSKFMLNLETLHTQYNLDDIELVLVEVLNNIVEHGGEDAQNIPFQRGRVTQISFASLL